MRYDCQSQVVHAHVNHMHTPEVRAVAKSDGALTSTNSVGGYSLIVGEGHESCKHSKIFLNPLNLPDLPTAALMYRLRKILVK